MSKRSLAKSLARLADDKNHVSLIDPKASRDVCVLPTGLDNVDLATVVGGYPEGRMTVLHGDPACGKTTLALKACAIVQNLGGTAVYIDTEHKLDVAYAEALGVNVEEMVVSEPAHIESSFAFMDKACELIRKDHETAPFVFIYDSLHAIDSKRSHEAEYEKDDFPGEPKAFSKCFRKFMPTLRRSGGILISISQVRQDLGGFIAKDKIAVGKAARHYATMVLKFKAKKERGKATDDGPVENVTVTVAKNQVALPWKTATYRIKYGEGPDPYDASLQAALELGLLVEGKQKWAEGEIGGKPFKVQGGDGMVKLALSDPVRYAELRADIRKFMCKSVGT